MTDLLRYEDQIYLLGFWLRTKIASIGEELSKAEPNWERLLIEGHQELFKEFGIADRAVIDEILEMWNDGENPFQKGEETHNV